MTLTLTWPHIAYPCPTQYFVSILLLGDVFLLNTDDLDVHIFTS